GFWELGLRPGDRAMIFVPMSIDLYVAMLAIIRVGAIAVFLDSFARQHQLGACSDLVEPKAFVGNELAHWLRGTSAALRDLPIQIRTGGGQAPGAVALDELVRRGSPHAVEPVTPDATALVTFTTGSSGTPKGANRTHEFLLSQHVAIDAHIPYPHVAIDFPA